MRLTAEQKAERKAERATRAAQFAESAKRIAEAKATFRLGGLGRGMGSNLIGSQL